MSHTTLAQKTMEFYDRLSSWESGVIANSTVTLQQMHALVAIDTKSPVRMKDLAIRLGVTMGTVTILVKRLIEQNLVKQCHNPDDARSRLLQLTPKGNKVCREHLADHEQLGDTLFSLFSKKEAQSFEHLLEVINEAF